MLDGIPPHFPIDKDIYIGIEKITADNKDRKLWKEVFGRSVFVHPGLRASEPLLAAPSALAHASTEDLYMQNRNWGPKAGFGSNGACQNDGWVMEEEEEDL